MADQKTLDYYNSNAAFYGNLEPAPDNQFVAYRNEFADRLNPESRVLDLGCGGGHASLAFLEHGFEVVALDGSKQLARIASQRTGINVVVRDFSQLEYLSEFDGIWAAASLTHVSLDILDDVLERVRNALRPEGLLYASFKCSEVDWRDAEGRFFSAINSDVLSCFSRRNGLKVESIDLVQGHGSFRDPVTWAWLAATRLDVPAEASN